MRAPFSRGERSRFGLSLKEPQPGFGRFTPASGRGNFVAQGAQPRIESCDRGAEFLNVTLGCSTFLAGDAHLLSVFVERRLLRVQGFNHLRQQLIGLFDLILLHAHLFAGRRNLQTMPLDERARLLATLNIGRNPALR